MLMRYHWAHAPGHLYMYQSSSLHATTNLTQQTGHPQAEDTAEAPEHKDTAEHDSNKTCDDFAQMGSDSDDTDSDFSAGSGLDDSSSSSGADSEGSEGSLDDDNDNGEAMLMYED